MTPNLPTLAHVVGDRSCIVVGSAPVESWSPDHGEAAVAVNGGIVSCHKVDAWVLNARTNADARHHRLYPLMVSQGAQRHVGLLVLMTWDDRGDPVADTLARLTKQGTTWDQVVDINNATRREIETAVGARTPSMQKHALSLGLSAACLCFFAGAASVRLEGFSWTPGYAYDTPIPVRSRGHVAGDRRGLVSLTARYGDRLSHSLSLGKEERSMPPRTSTAVHDGPPTPQPVTGPRKVRATTDVFYGGQRFREGDVFTLREPSHFKRSCMVDVPPDATSQRPTAAEHQARAKAIAQAMAGRRGVPTMSVGLAMDPPVGAGASREVL